MGYALSTEISLKFKELCQEQIEPFSSAEVMHGPKSLIENKFKLFVLILNDKSGNIICFSSQYVETPKPELSHYAIAKSALSGFIKSLAIEYSPFGIRANIVSPGMTDTDLIADIPLKVRMLTAAKTPMRRLTLPEDVAGTISFLVSNKSDFITGTNIRVNGGQIMI